MNPQAHDPRSGFGQLLAPGERQDLGNGRHGYRNPGALAVQDLGTDDWALILRSSATAPMAWVGHDLSTGDATLRAQRLDKSWNPTGGELEVWTAPAGGIRLQWVSATQLGDYELRWEEANEEGESLGGFRTLLDVDGKTLLEPELVQAPFAACVTPPSPCTL